VLAPEFFYKKLQMTREFLGREIPRGLARYLSITVYLNLINVIPVRTRSSCHGPLVSSHVNFRVNYSRLPTSYIRY